MKQHTLLTVTSLLSILLLSFHLADDIRLGFERGGLSTVYGVLILAVWLFGTLVLGGRRSGYIILLLGSILGAGIPVVHMTGKGLGSELVRSSGGLFFIWTLLALGASASLSLILSVHGLWSLRRGRAHPSV